MLVRVLKAFLRFGGFMVEPVPVAPRVAPANRMVAAKRVVPAPAQAAPVYKELPPRPTFGLATACSRYASWLDNGTLDRREARDFADVARVMGADLTAWQRALRLAGQSPWRPHGDVPDALARAVAKRLMLERLDTWERALAALDRLNREAAEMGWPSKPALDLPAEVAAALEARRKAALERAQQRARRGAAEGGSVPVPVPTEEVAAPLGPR